jgi:hypothetical protein
MKTAEAEQASHNLWVFLSISLIAAFVVIAFLGYKYAKNEKKNSTQENLIDNNFVKV